MSFNYNHSVLMGRLAKDPVLKQVSEKSTKLQLTLAVSRGYRKDNGSIDTDFIPVAFWGKTAEIGQQLLEKGTPVLIWGRIRVSTYEHDDQTKWMTEVVAENFRVLQTLKQREEKAEQKEKEIQFSEKTVQ